MKKRVWALCLVVILACAALIATGQAAGIFDFSTKKKTTVTITQEEYDRLSRYNKMDLILQYIEEWYIDEPDVDVLMDSAIQGMMYALDDPYTFYYDEASWKEHAVDDEGVYGGVGLQLLGSYEDYSVRITRVFRNTPAERAGIHKGDLLVRVEDTEVTAYTLQTAVDIMRGDIGQEVEIEVKRGNDYITFHVPRAEIHINRVEYTMLKDNVGYITLYEFAGESEKEFAQAFNDLRAQGAQALVVDLRDNGGGWVNAAIDIADLFLDQEVLVYAEDRYGTREDFKTKAGKDDIPLVILVNGGSASSSEILSGGLQDLGRATLVGTQTYGKGIIQTVISLDNDRSGFQMTYAQYFLPSGQAVHKVGITPDIISEMPPELISHYFELGDLSDPQLRVAWEEAKKLVQ